MKTLKPSSRHWDADLEDAIVKFNPVEPGSLVAQQREEFRLGHGIPKDAEDALYPITFPRAQMHRALERQCEAWLETVVSGIMRWAGGACSINNQGQAVLICSYEGKAIAMTMNFWGRSCNDSARLHFQLDKAAIAMWEHFEALTKEKP